MASDAVGTDSASESLNSLLENRASVDEGIPSDEDEDDEEISMDETNGFTQQLMTTDLNRNIHRSVSAPARANAAIRASRAGTQRTISEGHSSDGAPGPAGKGSRKRDQLSVHERHERRKQTNRKAAQKSRTREKEKESRLIRESLDEESKATSLRYEIKILTKAVEKYERILQEHRSRNRCVLDSVTNTNSVLTCGGSHRAHSDMPQGVGVCATDSSHPPIRKHESPTSTPSDSPVEAPFTSYYTPRNAKLHVSCSPPVIPNSFSPNCNSGSLQGVHCNQSPAIPSSSTGSSLETVVSQTNQPYTYIPLDRFRELACQVVNGGGNVGTNDAVMESAPGSHIANWIVSGPTGIANTTSVVDSTEVAPAIDDATTTTASKDSGTDSKTQTIFCALPSAQVADTDQYLVIASELSPTDIFREGLSVYIGDAEPSPQNENTQQHEQFNIGRERSLQEFSLKHPKINDSRVQYSREINDSIAVSALLELNRGIVEDNA